MKRGIRKKGFSLVEVNMAIFVMAGAILIMLILFPLGLRESVQSQADLKQSMFADYMLNVIVAAACNTNLTWTQSSSGNKTMSWGDWANNSQWGKLHGDDWHDTVDVRNLPPFIEPAVKEAEALYNKTQESSGLKRFLGETYVVYCAPVPGFSRQVMGIMMRSLDMNTDDMHPEEIRVRLEAQPVYYAEARFQGRP